MGRTTLCGAVNAEKMKRDGNTEVTEGRTQRTQSKARRKEKAYTEVTENAEFAEKSREEEPKSTDRSVCATEGRRRGRHKSGAPPRPGRGKRQAGPIEEKEDASGKACGGGGMAVGCGQVRRQNAAGRQRESGTPSAERKYLRLIA